MRISAVSYLNTKPFIYGIFRGVMADQVEISLDIPSECARKLLVGEADLALAPVAIIPELPESYIVSDYCIGATGTVKTVCLYAEKPLAEIRKLYLDFHSRTSVELARLLCREYWKIQPEFVPASEGYISKIQGDTAGLVIGDRTVGLDQKFPFVYDLGAAWTAWTGMPFVFAAWISTKPLDPEFVTTFNQALQSGLDHLPELIKILPAVPGLDLDDYYRHNISYDLDEAKWNGLNAFLTHIAGPNGYKMQRQSSASLVH
jgi:chorismate dehydratase